MNPLRGMLKDVVFVEDQAGKRVGPFKTAVVNHQGQQTAQIFEASLVVEDGNKLVRKMPNGRDEVYTILETHFQQGVGSVPAFWQLILSKGGGQRASTDRPGTTIHISHSQGIQIGDHNVQHIANSLRGLIETIDASPASKSEKAAAKSLMLKVLENPTVAGILGGAVGALIGLLKS